MKERVYDFEFVAYELIEPRLSFSEGLKFLKEQIGFNVVWHKPISSKDLNCQNLGLILAERGDLSPYEVDGLVITEDRVNELPKEGNPDFAFAFKMLIDTVDTEVISVEWATSRYGALKPVAKIIPVILNGTTVQNVTCNNARYVVQNKIGRGARVRVTKSGEIIPKIVSVLLPAESPDLPPASTYVWNDSNVDIMINQPSDDANIKKIVHFLVSIKVKHVSDGIITKLYRNGYDSIQKIFSMTIEDLLSIEGIEQTLAEKVFSNLHQGIQSAKIESVMAGSGIFGSGFGEKKALKLTENCKGKVWDMTEDDIVNIPGFSEKSSAEIVKNFASFKEFFVSLEKFFGQDSGAHDDHKESLKNFSDVVAVFSGFRDDALKKMIEVGGGQVEDRITKKTNLLVVENLEGKETSKVKEAKARNIHIVEKSSL